ncbi:hypothetical protein E2A64_06530 [Pseudohoeflea suaedae]|uniref:Uncharacterized protein n=1 Tax=Pseudohoeflea suaedae TaxID=877384 RepID=A0A4R5PNX5_9HYPH|nr:hypothetical protein [Pseudohoeflea suaedae]TDH38746.1 hypothetical protein E2A64_06530 [Pseudohoeflea suaedae]
MKNALIALGITLAATSGAFAATTARDAQFLPQETAASNPAAQIARSTDANGFVNTGPFGDRSPTYTGPAATQIDYTATSTIGSGVNVPLNKSPRAY